MKKQLLLVAVVFLLGMWLLMQGESNLSLAEVLQSLFGLSDSGSSFVVWNLRFPPIAAAILSGSLFGIAGLVFQRVLRNPIATPDIVGVSNISALGAVIPSMWMLLPIGFNFIGSVLLGALGLVVTFWAAGKNDEKRWRLVLAGVAISYLASGATNYIIHSNNESQNRQLYGWLIGSTSFASLQDVLWLALFLPVVGFLLFLISKPLAAIEVGDQQATGLGYESNIWVRATLGVGVLATAVAVAVVGPVAFVALTAPVIARHLIKQLSYLDVALVGAMLVLAADVFNQVFFSSLGLPTGITSGLIGAPAMLYVVLREQRIGMVR